MRNRVRAAIMILLSLALAASSAIRATAGSYCEETKLCADPADGVFNYDYYVGHDEPALLFYSSKPGSGNSSLYYMTLPTEPPFNPGSNVVNSYRLYTAFWLGMALCDSQSAPEFTHNECTPDSDSNIFDGSDPAMPDYAGHRPGGAYMELQFYPPATSSENPMSCSSSQWCVALNVDSFSADQTVTPQVFNGDHEMTCGDQQFYEVPE